MISSPFSGSHTLCAKTGSAAAASIPVATNLKVFILVISKPEEAVTWLGNDAERSIPGLQVARHLTFLRERQDLFSSSCLQAVGFAALPIAPFVSEHRP